MNQSLFSIGTCPSCKKINWLIQMPFFKRQQLAFNGRITGLELAIANKGIIQEPNFERFFPTTEFCSACESRGLVHHD